MDLLEKTVGDFGKWQLRISICMALLKFPIAWFQLGIVFLAPPTDHWCRQPEDFKLLTVEDWIEHIRPYGNETNYDDTKLKCLMRNVELPHVRELMPCKWGYDYDKSVIHSSIITEFNLVCGKESLVDVTQMTLMLGVLFGNIIFGVMADRIGRKKTLIASIIMQSACGMLSAWSPWLELFLVLRFLMAVANGGTMVTSFVMCMEVVGGIWRIIVPILYQIPFGIGNTLMAGLAYYLRDWRELQLALSVFSGFFIVYIWLIPESPRWLIATGKRKEAAVILEKAAKHNGMDEREVKKAFLAVPETKQEERAKFSSVLKTPNLRKRTLLLCVNWLICGVTFYGFTQYLGQIGSNIYFTVAVGGLITIPGTMMCVFIIKRYGRKWTIASSYFFISLCFLAILLIPTGRFVHDWPRISFAGLGIIGLSIATPALYLFTGELFPTVLRNAGVGGTVMWMRLGSMASPFIISLKTYSAHLPLIILASLTLLQSILILPLPESSALLPDTVKDIEMSEIVNNNDILNGNYLSVPIKVPEEDE